MKICPVCKKNFDDSVRFCPQDNEILDDDMRAMVGQTLDGQYLIEKMLGQGGMGAVFLARHTLLGDRVAIKIMPTHISKNPEYQRRFLREGQAARRFRHPNVVQVHDLRSTSDGTLYMVLEYIEGNSLHDELKKRKRFTPAEAVKILEPVAEALDTAHAIGVIHRDLKPDNIMIGKTEDGAPVVKLLDLGVAKVHGNDMTALTMAGQILGTPHYMSPEQWNGQELDGRADIYSLGIVFYELILGKRPFEGRTLENLACQHALTVPPALAEVIKGVPIGFSNAIAQSMAKEADQRQANCRELFDQLKAALKADAGLRMNDEHSPTLVNVESVPTIQLNDQKADTGGDKEGATIIKDGQPVKTLGLNTPIQPPPNTANDRPAYTEEAITLNAATKEGYRDSATSSSLLTANKANGNTLNNDQLAVKEADAPLAGQTLHTIKADPRESPAVSSSNQSRALAEPATTSRLPIMLIAAVLALSLGSWFGWRYLHPATAPLTNGTSGNGNNSGGIDTVELMRYWLSIAPITDKGAFKRKAEVSGLPSHQAFRIHFLAPQTGYLYIVATGKGNSLTTFLTAKPFPDAGISSNQLNAGQQFDFPNGKDEKGDARLILLDADPGTEIYTVIYNATPLLSPSFLTSDANHELNTSERKEWEDFRAQNRRLSAKIIENGQPYATIDLPKSQQDGKPNYFDIIIEHK